MRLPPAIVRDGTRSALASLGVNIPVAVPPLLEADLGLSRSSVEVAQRSLAIFSTICVVAEPPQRLPEVRRLLRSWVSDNDLLSHMTPTEVAIVFEDAPVSRTLDASVREQVEPLLALSWAIGLVDVLDPREAVHGTFGRIFPNVAEGSPRTSFIRDARLRDEAILFAQLDQYYCLDWAYREASINQARAPLRTPDYIIRGRRAAFEWLFSDDAWGEQSLDT